MSKNAVLTLCDGFLSETTSKKVVKEFPNQFLVQLAELALNFLKGSLEDSLSEKDIKELEKYSVDLHFIASSQSSIAQKRKYLLQHPQLFLCFKLLFGAEAFSREQNQSNEIVQEDEEQEE